MLVGVHALSVVYSLSLREFAAPSLCFHVPIFMAAWCLKPLYSCWLYLLWWCLQLQWDFIAAGCFPSHFAQRLGCWAKGNVQFEEVGFLHPCEYYKQSLNYMWAGGYDKSRKLLVPQETCSSRGACVGGVWDPGGGMTGEGGASQGEMFLKQFMLLILTIVLLLNFSAGDQLSH